MKLPIDWLKEYVSFDCSPAELADLLTMAGHEVEESISLSAADAEKAGGTSASAGRPILNLKITPNRGDCLSIVGLAREISAVLNSPFTPPQVAIDTESGYGSPISDVVSVEIQDPDLCQRYSAVLVRNVKINPSPDWLKDRLIQAGLRPINNVVDITNYILWELGQPLHAFDCNLIKGGKIIVRRAKEGEIITTIDATERRLESNMLVIADAERAVAVAGVMGGMDSEVTDETTDVLIESARFDPVSIRTTSKKLGLVTEASYRFERHVDPGLCVFAAKRAAEMMRDIAGGQIAAGVLDEYPGRQDPLVLKVRPERVNKILGTNLTPDQMIAYLERLGLSTSFGEVLHVTIPSRRNDLTREIDLIEEIARIHGYNNIPTKLPLMPMLQGADAEINRFESEIRETLLSCGCQEVVSHTFVSDQLVELTGILETAVKVRNPLSEDLGYLRPSLIPSLLSVVSRNHAYGIRDLAIFEVGRIYSKTADGSFEEPRRTACALSGIQWNCAWSLDRETLRADFFLCKGIAQELLSKLGIKSFEFKRTSAPYLHPGRAAEIMVGDTIVGVIGEISSRASELLDLREPVVVFEMDTLALKSLKKEQKSYKPAPKFPSVNRHIAVVVDVSVDFKSVYESALSADSLIENIELMDVYQGKHLPENKKSLTLSIDFRSPKATLTEEQISVALEAVKTSLRRDVGADFRA